MSNELAIKPSQTEKLIVNAKDYCLLNGLVMFTNIDKSDPKKNFTVLHSPITLFPSEYPRKEFDYAIEIQNHFNILIYSIAKDNEFLSNTLNDIAQIDAFTKKLMDIMEAVKSEGIVQPNQLCIMRNDYILDMNKMNNGKTLLSQIEYNTISCASGAATNRVSALHRYLLRISENESYIDKQAPNDNVNVLANGLVESWRLYGNSKAKMIFLVRRNEPNIGDQRILEYKCMEIDSKLDVLRVFLDEVVRNGKLDDKKRLFINDDEIGMVYFRCGYDPIDYPTEEYWNARLMIERSRAIKCPTVAYQLAGCKRIQQELFRPGVVEKYISDPIISEKIRAVFVDQHSFNSDNTSELVKLVESDFENYVLKPQREGGGNKFFGKEIQDFLKTRNKSELIEYVLMKLVKGVERENYILKPGQDLVKESLISEMGIFGVLVGNDEKVLINKTGGYLLRSKFAKAKEGGIGIGTAALDSIVFKD